MEESRTTSSLKNIGFSVFNQLLNIVLTFISRKVFVMCLSVDYLGISGLFGDIFSMLCLADLGFGTAMTFSMYRPLAEKDYDRLAGLIHFYKKVYRIIAFAITAIGLLLIPFLPYLVNTEREIEHLTLYYVLMLANVVASYLVVYKTCIISADQKSYLTTKYTSVFSIARTVFQTVFLILTHNYTVYLIIQVLFTYLTNFFNSYVAGKKYPYIKRKVVLPKSETKGIFSNIKSVFIYKLSGVLITATDNTILISSSGSFTNASITIQFPDGQLELSGSFGKGSFRIVLEKVDATNGMDYGMKIETSEALLTSIKVRLNIDVPENQTVTSALVYRQADMTSELEEPFDPDFISDEYVEFTTTNNSYYWIDAEFETEYTPLPPLDDDDDYVPPIYVPSESSSSDNDTVKIVACAAATVVAAIMAAFLILGHRKD